MSLYPNRKKLTEYPTVTPTLSDSVVNIQSSTVKQSTLQSILNLFNANLPQATETTKGIAEIATQAEVTTGTNDTKFITPLKLKTAVPAASSTVVGVTSFANQTESEEASSLVIGSINNTKAMTPRTWRWAWDKALTIAWSFAEKISFLKGINLVSSTVPLVDGDLTFNSTTYNGRVSGNVVSFITSNSAATESVKGIAEIATQAEVTTGTDDTRFVTPLKLKQNQFNSASVTSTALNPFIVTLNSIAGNIIIPTGVGCNIISGTGQTIILNNNFLTTTSVIEYTIRSYGKILLQGGYNVSTSVASISVFNVDINTVTQLDIYFKILNP